MMTSLQSALVCHIYMYHYFYNFLLGLFNLPLSALKKPPTSRLLRRIDTNFVESLKKRIKEDGSNIGASPFAVVCLNVPHKSKFEERLKEVYNYEVHGGLHNFKAREELVAEGTLSQHCVVLCDTYVQLTDEESLWLASRHNTNGHFNHHMTHRNYVRKLVIFMILLMYNSIAGSL